MQRAAAPKSSWMRLRPRPAHRGGTAPSGPQDRKAEDTEVSALSSGRRRIGWRLFRTARNAQWKTHDGCFMPLSA
eukprot:14566980-Alexandrium_andersonii.AAC.1